MIENKDLISQITVDSVHYLIQNLINCIDQNLV